MRLGFIRKVCCTSKLSTSKLMSPSPQGSSSKLELTRTSLLSPIPHLVIFHLEPLLPCHIAKSEELLAENDQTLQANAGYHLY